MWEIYDLLVENIHDGDEIYLDITGGIRSISSIGTPILNYICQVKNNVAIKDTIYVYYDKEADNEVFSIHYFMQLTEWAIGIQNYIQYGDPSYLKKLVTEEDKDSPEYLLVDSLDQFSVCQDLCLIKDAEKLLPDVFKNIHDMFHTILLEDDFVQTNVNKKIDVLKKQLEDTFDCFREGDFILESIKWDLRVKKYQQALSVLNEYVGYIMMDITHLIKGKHAENRTALEPFKQIQEGDDPAGWVVDENMQATFTKEKTYIDYKYFCEVMNRNSLFPEKFYENAKYIQKIGGKESREWIMSPTFMEQIQNSIQECNLSFDEQYIKEMWVHYLKQNLKKKENECMWKMKDLLNLTTNSEDIRRIWKSIFTFQDIDTKKDFLRNKCGIEDVSGLDVIRTELENLKVIDNYVSINKNGEYRFLTSAEILKDKNNRSAFINKELIENKEAFTIFFAKWNAVRNMRNMVDHAQLIITQANINVLKNRDEFCKSILEMVDMLEIIKSGEYNRLLEFR